MISYFLHALLSLELLEPDEITTDSSLVIVVLGNSIEVGIVTSRKHIDFLWLPGQGFQGLRNWRALCRRS